MAGERVDLRDALRWLIENMGLMVGLVEGLAATDGDAIVGELRRLAYAYRSGRAELLAHATAARRARTCLFR